MAAIALPRLFRRNERGVSAVEFALVLPLMLILFFGGYVMSEAVTISRKVSITTRTLADLTTQNSTSITTQDMQTILGAATQVMAPYGTGPMSIRLSEISTDITGLIATVTWSTAVNTTPYTCNKIVTLPAGMALPSSSYVYAEVSYLYQPIAGTSITGVKSGGITLADRIYMSPRLSQSINYPCPG